ncbi:uncharacterized protein LOC142326646 [Lycorma delicatula]|uniref:uncharacterized protein LOC142326646 n=1 Tax=Lycorma delicatula TaxID=130591 RepID=UPI003F515FE8
MICSVCSKALPSDGNVVFCNSCKSSYHFNDCAGLAEPIWSSKSESDKSEWRCRNCKETKNSADESSSGLSSELRQGFNMIRQSLEEVFKDEFETIKSQNYEMERVIREYKDKMVESWSIKSLQEELQTIKYENIKLQESHSFLQKETQDLFVEIQMMEQYSRNRNIEVHGIPYKNSENLEFIIQKIFNRVDVTLQKGEYTAYRLPVRTDGSRAILLQFDNRKIRDEILRNSKRLKLKLKDLDKSFPNSPLYIGENLNSYNKKLFYDIKMLNKQKGYQYVWFANSRLLVKKNNSSKPIWIKSITDFNNL